MSILGIARFTFHQGKANEFLKLNQQCRRVVDELDTGTLRYEVFLNEDRSQAIVIEEYEDEQAAIAHNQNIGGELMAAVSATGEVHGELLGELSDELREQLHGGPVTPFLPLTC